MDIRKLNESHREELKSLYLEGWETEWDPWLKDLFDGAVLVENNHYKLDMYGIFVDGQLASAAGIGECMHHHSMVSLRIGVTHPIFRGKGLFSILLDFRMSILEESDYESIIVTTKVPSRYDKYDFKILDQMNDGYYIIYKTIR